MLGVRPYPAKEENLTQYLLRLAYVNGYFKVSELLSCIAMDKPKNSRFGIWGESQLQSLDAALTVALNRPVDKILKLDIRDEKKRWIYDKNRLFVELVVDFPRFCHKCVLEQQHFDWRWSIATIGRCRIHKSLLIDCCPNCGKQFDWDSNIFELCPSCNFKWLDIKKSHWENIALSPLEILLWPDADGQIDASESLLNDLSLAIHGVARPYDILRQSFKRVPKITNHSLLVMHALQLLESEQYAKNWSKQCLVIWRKYEKLLNPVSEFKALLSQTYESGANWQLKQLAQLDNYIQPARMAYVSNQKKEKPEFHINLNHLCRAFKICRADALILIESGALPQVNRTLNNNGNVISNKIFNLENIVTDLTRIQSNQQRKKYSELLIVQADDKLLHEHLCRYGELISAVLVGDIPGEIINVTDLNSLKVSKKAYMEWLIDKFDSACYNPIPVNDVALALGVEPSEIDNLVSNSELFWARWYKNRGYIDENSFKKYIAIKALERRIDDVYR